MGLSTNSSTDLTYFDVAPACAMVSARTRPFTFGPATVRLTSSVQRKKNIPIVNWSKARNLLVAESPSDDNRIVGERTLQWRDNPNQKYAKASHGATDEVERRRASPASNKGILSQPSTPSLAYRRRDPRSLEPIVRRCAWLKIISRHLRCHRVLRLQDTSTRHR
jgi:hypothetical protein